MSPSVERIVDWMGAFIPRVMFPGSLAAAARLAGAEPLWTGRSRAYAESTLRLAAGRLDAEGASTHVARAVWRQVTGAVAMADEEVIAHTDMFDQPYYTKKFAHAAPIGRLGNRILACAYFGLTTISIPGGPTLFVHLSWHKPASPLRDALEDLFDDERRLDWWQDNVRLLIIDRGANGDPVLRWLGDLNVPYLTISRESAELWRFRVPTLRSEYDLPIVVRPDRRLDGDAEDGPWEVIVPADPSDPAERRGIRFRSAVEFGTADLLALNALYKSRWPSMENEIKAAQALGFGRNRTRCLDLTTSRGTDGELARLRAREAAAEEEVEELGAAPASGDNLSRVVKAGRKVLAARAKQVEVEAEASIKYARVEGGAERLGKWLHLLVHNAIALALASSPVEEVRVMDLPTVFELLLRQPALTCIEDGKLTLCVNALDAAADRRRQQALVEVINTLKLGCRGKQVAIRILERPTAKAM